MKRVLKILLTVGGLYVLFWFGVAIAFTVAGRYQSELESSLSRVLGRAVTIENVKTNWYGVSPQFQLENLKIEGDSKNQAAFAFERLSARMDAMSLLRLRPVFKEFAVDAPQLEIATFNDGRIQVAGFEVKLGQGSPEGIINWLLDQRSGVWHNGSLIWQREGKTPQRYNDISFVYDRQQKSRTIHAAIETAKGSIAFRSRAKGNPFSERDWDASFEVLGSGGRRLLTADDFSAKVVDGVGQLSLTVLHMQRVQDFLQFAGLTPDRHWLLAAEVDGRLHDVELKFSGPLLAIEDWSLQAAASNLRFTSPGAAPSMNNLSGALKVSRASGEFQFATQGAEFRWPNRFKHALPIQSASGSLSWELPASGVGLIRLKGGEFHDPSIHLRALNAELTLNRQSRRINTFGDLFKVENVVDLSFDDGSIVDASNQNPPQLTASALFELSDVTRLSHYLPKSKKLDAFRKWSEVAFKSGTASNGRLSYQGELSAQAFNENRATFEMDAEFENAEVDYSPKLRWPAIKQANGSARIRNQLLTIIPEQAMMNGDPVTQSELTIERLFQVDRLLKVRGKTTTSLEKGLEFVFKGPLIKPEEQLSQVPFDVKAGWVDMDVNVTLPLNNLSSVTVSGTSLIYEGEGFLPSQMPMRDISGLVRFTESAIESDNIRATFLGGETRAKLETISPALPPVMRLTAQGTVHAQELEPWTGEHLLTIIKGKAPWQGAMLIEGNSLQVTGVSDLIGMTVDAPAPVGKSSESAARMDLSMQLGVAPDDFSIDMSYKDILLAKFQAAAPKANSNVLPSLFDQSLIALRDTGLDDVPKQLGEGINFDFQYAGLNVDQWLETVIDLATYVPKVPIDNTVFLDAMRSIKLVDPQATFSGRPYGLIDVNALSVDGKTWIGTLAGDHLNGTMHLEPRRGNGHYDFDLDRFDIPDLVGQKPPPEAVDYSLRPENYPIINVRINRLSSGGKPLGRLTMGGEPEDDVWRVNKLELIHNGIFTSATGAWTSDAERGSISRFEFDTRIDEAGDALDEMDFKGILRKGQGSAEGVLSWIGAPHEFDYARLNGEFNAFVKDGELVQVEPGGGKILGLLNMNAILRRLVFDFSDVVASGLRFDRMRLSGVLADGEAVLQDAFVLSPAVFVTMEGRVNLDKELIDMEMHVSPELGGNIALLSALANPAAGAVVFLTQQLFKDDLRKNSFRSYRALGSWDEFELEELDTNADSAANEDKAQPELPSDALQIESIEAPAGE